MNRIAISLIMGGALTLFSVGCAKKSVDDQALTTAIQSKLYSDAATRAAGINVAVKDGVVTLSGDVPSSDVALEAVKIANGTEGVRSVDQQQLKVNSAVAATPPPPAPDPASPLASSKLAGPSPAPSPAYPPKEASTAAAPAPMPAPESQPAPVAAAAKPAPPPKPVEPTTVTIPAGTRLSVRTIDAIDSGKASDGQTYRGSLDSPLISRGRVVVPAGSDVTLTITNVKGAGRIKGNSELSLKATTLQYRGRAYNLASSVIAEEGKARGKNTAIKTGLGAAAGALIGGLAGGGKGAGIGAAAGGGAGFGWNALSHGQQVKIPAETVLNFQLESGLTVPTGGRASDNN